MKRIPLTQGKFTLVDNADYDWLNRYKWHTRSRDARCCYASRNIWISNSKRRPTPLHRVILNAPDGIEVDHINGDGLDNRRSNLRLCSRNENARNRRLNCNSKTGFKGVHLTRGNRKKPYRARIRLNGRRVVIGWYKTPEAAAQVYDLAALEHHGKFALTNKMLGLL